MGKNRKNKWIKKSCNNFDFECAQWYTYVRRVIQVMRTACEAKNLIRGDEFSFQKQRGTTSRSA